MVVQDVCEIFTPKFRGKDVYSSSLVRGSLNGTHFWEDQSGNSKGFSRNIGHCLGWQYFFFALLKQVGGRRQVTQ